MGWLTLHSDRDKTRVKCAEREGAGDFLNVVPSKALGLHLRKLEFNRALRFRLGLRVCPMVGCRAHSDKYGDHTMSCAHGWERIAKHNHLRDAVYGAAVQAGLGPLKEPAGLLPGSDKRPADVLLPGWTEGRDTALDITVVNPFQAAMVHRAAEEGEYPV